MSWLRLPRRRTVLDMIADALPDHSEPGVPVASADGPDLRAAEVRARSEFREELEDLINRHSLEELAGDTPDHIVAEHLTECLIAFGKAVRQRSGWYGSWKDE